MRTLWIGLALTTLIASMGCKKDGGDSSEESEAKAGGSKSSSGVSMRSGSELIGNQADKIPAGADVVMAIEVGPLLKGLMENGAFGLIPPVKDPDAFRKDLGGVYKRFVGLDVTAVDYVVGFVVIEKQAAAAIIVGDFGDIDLPGDKQDIAGVQAVALDRNLLVAPFGDGLVIGNPAGIELVVDKSDKLAGTDLLETHQSALKQVGNGLGSISIRVPKELVEEALAGSPFPGVEVEHVSAVFGARMAVAIQANEASLKTLLGFIDMGLAGARGVLAGLEADIEKTDDFEKAMAGVAAKHLGSLLLEIPQIENKDGTLSVSIELPGGGMAGGVETMWLVGVLSVVAIPAFIKYQRRALTSEAIDQLDKIYKSSSNYYSAPRVARGTGIKIPCQFPEPQKMTPDVSGRACCGGENDRDGDDRCDVNVSQWATMTWASLNFQMNDQHYFGYAYDSSGTLGAARFTASAYADLDCDGILSTFERYGYGDGSGSGSGSYAECSMKGSSVFYKDKETE